MGEIAQDREGLRWIATTADVAEVLRSALALIPDSPDGLAGRMAMAATLCQAAVSTAAIVAKRAGFPARVLSIELDFAARTASKIAEKIAL